MIAGQLGITRDEHNHNLAPNPFIYKVHEKATTQYQQAISLALAPAPCAVSTHSASGFRIGDGREQGDFRPA